MTALLPILALLAAPPAPLQEPTLHFSKSDRDAAAKEVEKWFAEKEAKESTSKAIEAIEKKLGDAAKKAKVDDPLTCIADLEAILDSIGTYKSTGFTLGNESTRDYVGPGGEKQRYGLRLPKKYEPAKVAYPLLVSIPGLGEDVKNHLANAWKHDGLRDAAILYAPEIPKGTEAWTDVGGRNLVLLGIQDLWGLFRIDRNRLLLAGRGESALLALRLATWFPDRIAGVVLFQLPEAKLVVENLRNVPVLLAGEGPGSKALATRLNDLGYAVEEKGDDLEVVAAWILDRRRAAYPEEVVFQPARPFAKNANWVRIGEYDAGGKTDILELPEERRPSLKGKIDRGKNEITFETRGILEFDVLLNDALLDLGKPVRVVLNGQAWEGTYERSLEYLLELVFLRNDPSTLYVASHACRVAQESIDRAPEPASGPKEGEAGTGTQPK